MKIMPFFTFYGGKHRATKNYPSPTYETIIEPFCGSAGYSLNFPDHNVILRDVDPIIVGTWQYLIGADADEILGLPDLKPAQSVNDLDIPQAARWLIGWWLNKGSATPKLRPSTFMLNYPAGAPYWGERIRQRIASQLPMIRHWRAELGSYTDAGNDDATWFIDPPYQKTGKHYRFDDDGINFTDLAKWCKSRRGQVIVCEADDADWLPFRPLVEIDGNEGRQKKSRARMEVVWP